jgi:5-methylcytosine-specific restriction protein A
VGRLKTLGSRIATLDTRRVKPPPKIADPELLTPEHRAWRSRILARAGYRCEWIENGRRCEKRAPEHRMIADHIVERADGGDPQGEGQCLCVQHNTFKGLRARTARHSAQGTSHLR